MKAGFIGLSLAVLAAVPFWVGGCGPTTAGNPQVTLEFDTYNQSVALLDWFSLIRPAHAGTVSQIDFCFKRLRFKPRGGSVGGNIDLTLGHVMVDGNTATELVTVNLDPTTYERLEFDLEDGCGTGYSLRVANSDAGSPFTSGATITIRFEGLFTAVDGPQVLSMSLQNIVNQLDTVAANADVKPKAEAASGTF